jgi:hypothetical protein
MSELRLCVLLAAGMLCVADIACAQSNFVLFTKDYYVGVDQTQVTSNPADFTVSGSPAAIKVSAFGFDCYFGGPGGTNLAVGPYPNSVRYPLNGSSPGFDIINTNLHLNCSTDCGGFQVKELHTGSDGQVDRLWVTFSNQCNCSIVGGGQMRGEIRFNSQLADQAVVYLNCPSNVVANAPFGKNSAVVTYPAPDGTPGAWITSTPASGSVFPAGTNVVVTTLLYGTNALTCSFNVIVQVAPFTIVTMLTPTDGAIVSAPGNLRLQATATTDSFNSIASINFLSLTNVLGVVANPLPGSGNYYFFLQDYASEYWSNVPAGHYALQAIAQNSSGLSGTSAVVNVIVVTNLVQNPGFETGDFTGWTLVGTPAPPLGGPYNTVPPSWTTSLVRHSGVYGAYLGDIQMASLSQTLSTVQGQYYLLSLWLDNPVSGTNQFFKVSWNTNTAATNVVLSVVNPPALSWTKLESLVLATATNTTIQIQAENDPGYFGLDDIFVTPIPQPTFQAAAIDNSFQLSWLTAPGVAYQVQYKTNLLQTSWDDLIPAFVATDYSSMLLDTNSVSSSQRFYRLTLP